MSKLMDIEGIGAGFAVKLGLAGIRSPRQPLERGASARGRKLIAGESSISEKQILEWVNHIDLFRVKGIGGQYADLLEAAGVDTVVELAQRNPENLHRRIAEMNEERRLVRKLPSLFQVREWVQQAGKLPKVVTY